MILSGYERLISRRERGDRHLDRHENYGRVQTAVDKRVKEAHDP